MPRTHPYMGLRRCTVRVLETKQLVATDRTLCWLRDPDRTPSETHVGMSPWHHLDSACSPRGAIRANVLRDLSKIKYSDACSVPIGLHGINTHPGRKAVAEEPSCHTSGKGAPTTGLAYCLLQGVTFACFGLV